MRIFPILGLAAIFAACSSGGSGGSGVSTCMTGTTNACPCSVGVGVQTCQADGSFSACNCSGGTTTDGGALSDAAANGDTGSASDGGGSNDSGGVTGSLCGVDTSSLLAYLPFDGDLTDHSGNGNNASAAPNAILFVAGTLGGAVAITPSGTGVHMTGTPQIGGTTGFTFCAWVRPTAPTSGPGQPLFVSGKPGAGDQFSLASLSPGGGTCFSSQPSSLYFDHWSSQCITSTLKATLNAWSFVCLGTTDAPFLYANGTLVQEPLPIVLFPTQLATVTIGADTIGGTTTMPLFRGDIDEVSIWSKALSSSELAKLWNGGVSCPIQ